MSQVNSSMGKRPLMALQRAMNKEVRVRLKNMLEYRGTLINVDSYMNMFLDNAFEHREDGHVSEKLGRVVIRGNNVLYVVLGDESLL
ncbi:LSM domain-containing protein [Conexivisphaera calida]|uniref:SnRNP Sm-like protein n=1 Tax=Conexivisphaera calida TaxID=1874277 RepID=A0A4P2VJD7_9ARCH|nr:LSM domain-containing protein [Conexivisphaera calida]BBE41438.1 Putative snRNP Sm-like protein [Conexivisphaera calida]